MKDSYSKSIGKEAAIALSDSKWWEGLPAREIARRQLFTRELCCPFAVFHEAIEATLGRPVFTHEFGLNYDGICQEFLGEADAPTLDEIIELIPADILSPAQKCVHVREVQPATRGEVSEEAIDLGSLGKFERDVDGFYYFWPESKGGCYSAFLLISLATKLDRMNAEWERTIERELGGSEVEKGGEPSQESVAIPQGLVSKPERSQP